MTNSWFCKLCFFSRINFSEWLKSISYLKECLGNFMPACSCKLKIIFFLSELVFVNAAESNILLAKTFTNLTKKKRKTPNLGSFFRQKFHTSQLFLYRSKVNSNKHTLSFQRLYQAMIKLIWEGIAKTSWDYCAKWYQEDERNWLWHDMIYLYETLCTIWYHLYNFKNVKNTHGGVLLY